MDLSLWNPLANPLHEALAARERNAAPEPRQLGLAARTQTPSACLPARLRGSSGAAASLAAHARLIPSQ